MRWGKKNRYCWEEMVKDRGPDIAEFVGRVIAIMNPEPKEDNWLPEAVQWDNTVQLVRKFQVMRHEPMKS